MNIKSIKLNKKFIISIIMCLLIIIALIIGIAAWNFSGKVKSKVFLFDKDTQNVYVLNSDGEKKKIAGNINNIRYNDKLGRYIAVDNDNVMYMISKNGISEKMASDVVFDTIKMPDSQRVFFIGIDDKLFYKKPDGGKQQVKTDILDYYVLNDNDNIYIDTEDNLLYHKFGTNVSKLASNVSKVKISPNKKIAAYISENKLFVTDLETNETEKISDATYNGNFEFVDNDAIVYFDNYDQNEGNGELYYKKVAADKVKLASDVSSIAVSEKKCKEGFYYITSDKSLYYYNFEDSSTVLVLENTERIDFSTNGTAFVSDASNNIYSLKKTNAKKIFEEAADFNPTKDNVAVLDKNNILYLGNTKVADGVESFDVNENEIIYVDNSNDIYLYKGKHGTQKIGNTNDYSRVVFQDDILYQGNIKNDDIVGCWRYYDYQTKYQAYYKFTDDYNISLMDFNNLERTYKYKIESEEPGKMTIYFNNQSVEISINEYKNLILKYPDGSTFELKRVTEDDYDDAYDIIENIYTEAQELYGQNNAVFKYVKKVKDYNYYLYGTKNYDNNYRTEIYTDQYGSPFIYEEDTMKPLLNKDKY